MGSSPRLAVMLVLGIYRPPGMLILGLGLGLDTSGLVNIPADHFSGPCKAFGGVCVCVCPYNNFRTK